MKRLVVFTCFWALLFATGAKPAPTFSGKGIQFSKDGLAKALQTAKAQKKLVFIDVYATWCGPCMQLKWRTFPNKNAGQFFNANFVNLSLDGEKGEGLQLFRAYQLRAFPTLIILNSDGKPLLAAEGYMDTKTLIAFGKAAQAKQSE